MVKGVGRGGMGVLGGSGVGGGVVPGVPCDPGVAEPSVLVGAAPGDPVVNRLCPGVGSGVPTSRIGRPSGMKCRASAGPPCVAAVNMPPVTTSESKPDAISSALGAGWPVIAGVISPRSVAPTPGAVTNMCSNVLLTTFLKGAQANKGAVTPDRMPLAAAIL